MTGPARADADVLGKLLVIQGVLDAVPDRAAQAELLCRVLREVPGIAAAHVCFRDTVVPPHPACAGPCALARDGRAGGDEPIPCEGDPRAAATRRLPMSTTNTFHGFLTLALDGPAAVAPYTVHLANIANLMAVLLEKRAIHEHLERVLHDLERQVSERTAELRTKNASLEREIAHRRTVETALRRAHADLERRVRERTAALTEADRRKDEFLAMLAHELRNPLAPIRHAAHILRRTDGGTTDHRWSLDVIDRQVESLARVVDDLLDVSRITQGKIVLQREPVALATVVGRAVEASRPMIDAHEHRLVVTDAPTEVWVDGDAVRLTQVVANLLHNAAKYTPSRGRISVTTEIDGATVHVRVRDTGIGMSRDILPYVFDLFMQADRSLDRAKGGLGIGLTLVKRLVEMHGGRVHAESDGPGRGSEFSMTLPVMPRTPPSPVAPPVAPPAAGRRRVLVVDDNADAGDSLAMLVELAGHEARVARDGATALAATEAFQPHVVVLDIGLPGMDGYEVARRLRRPPFPGGIRLVAVTGYGQHEDRQRSEAAGFDHHFVKPVEWDAIQAVLDSLPGTA